MATDFTINLADLQHILDQIIIAERHAAGENLVDIIGQDAALLPFGLRTVDGSYNNLLPGQSQLGAADQLFPRLLTPDFRDDADGDVMPLGPPGSGAPIITNTNYALPGSVADADPRIISNLISDQTIGNMAALSKALSQNGSTNPFGDAMAIVALRDAAATATGAAAATAANNLVQAIVTAGLEISNDGSILYGFAVQGAPANNICLFRNNAAGNPWVEAPITLPNGSLIQSVEFRFCDTNAAAAFTSFLTINSKTVAVAQPVMVSSTAAEVPGCINRTFTLAPALVVDNNDKAYSLEVNLGANTNTISVCHARVYYRLQVSPAPATATFTDVPVGAPQHRFVEALVAAGITAGCGGGNYCPNDPVTRGQMAVFIAASLGMHFPN